MYTQCKLYNPKNNSEMVSYIPTKYAVLGNIIKVEVSKGNWESGWHVIEVNSVTDSTPDWRKGIRNHRKNTGDSL